MKLDYLRGFVVKLAEFQKRSQVMSTLNQMNRLPSTQGASGRVRSTVPGLMPTINMSPLKRQSMGMPSLPAARPILRAGSVRAGTGASSGEMVMAGKG